MFKELKGLIEGLTTKGANLYEQAKHDRALLQADQNNLAIPNEDFNEHVLAKKIELPSSQSNGEDFLLDEPTSKEGTTLSIDDEEPEVEAGEILDNNHISKTDVVPPEDKLEGTTKQSTLEEEIGLHTNGEPQLRMMVNHNFQVASFLM
ncbi:hypothetical protein ACLB2K_020301 [Fragaria x ananassa]